MISAPNKLHPLSNADLHDAVLAPCPVCDGAGEWDEGPLPASSGATEPDYRQVICPECDGTGKAFVEAEPRTLEDLEADAEEEAYQGPVALALGAENLAAVMKPTMDASGNWTEAPAAEIDHPHDKRVIRAGIRSAIAAGLNLDLNDHPERDNG